MFESRKYIIQVVFILVAAIFASRLFYLQVVDSSYIKAAADNAVQRLVEYPYRGVMYDRTG